MAERIPQPMTIDAAVSNDPANRTLVVKGPENAGGYQKLSWRTAHQTLQAAEQKGWRSAVPTLWASGAGQTEIAYGVPGDNLSLRFHFPAVADSPYTKLVSQPGLSAFVTVDRSTGWVYGRISEPQWGGCMRLFLAFRANGTPRASACGTETGKRWMESGT
jgi:hypothetical protein